MGLEALGLLGYVSQAECCICLQNAADQSTRPTGRVLELFQAHTFEGQDAIRLREQRLLTVQGVGVLYLERRSDLYCRGEVCHDAARSYL